MKNEAAFLKITDEAEISKKTAPEFLLLYQQSVLLSLKEQGVLNEMQYGLCLNALVNSQS